jgi:signal peptidase II
MNARSIGLACALAAFALDQVTKTVALVSPAIRNGVELLPVLNLVLVRNHGVSFGLLSGLAPWWALVALAFAIVAGLSRWLWKSDSRMVSAALGMIIGGAIGNVLDRLRHGAVTDFLDFYLGEHHWPAFNLADAAIFCGAALLVLDSFRATRRKRNGSGSADRRDVTARVPEESLRSQQRQTGG